jgi:hypothetical protein
MPVRAWSAKDERQYEHVKATERQRGRSLDRAKEIAARTVNKQRRREGRVGDQPSRATGNPTTSLEDRSMTELRNRSRILRIPGRSAMRKAELIAAIRERS